MRHGITTSEWVSRFADSFVRHEPQVDRPLALDLARVILPALGALAPDEAAETYLAFQSDRKSDARKHAQQVMRTLHPAP